jgi:hypothetical protein
MQEQYQKRTKKDKRILIVLMERLVVVEKPLSIRFQPKSGWR